MKIGILGCDEHILAVAVAAVEGGHTLSPAYDVPEDLPTATLWHRPPATRTMARLTRRRTLQTLSLLVLMAGANIVRNR